MTSRGKSGEQDSIFSNISVTSVSHTVPGTEEGFMFEGWAQKWKSKNFSEEEQERQAKLTESWLKVCPYDRIKRPLKSLR